MPILPSDSIGSLKKFTCVLPAPQETYLSTPLTLPTSEPATGQINFTVQASDFPVYQPSNLPFRASAFVLASGKVGAVGVGISYRLLKNGVSIAQATSAAMTATQWWNHTHYRFYDIIPGDQIELRIWCAQADYTLDYMAMYVAPVDIDPVKRGTMLTQFTLTTSIPKLTGAGMPQVIGATTTGSYLTKAYMTTTNLGFNGAYTYNALQFQPNVPMLPAQYGGSPASGGSNTNANSHATQRQFLYQASLVLLSYREVRL